MATAASRGVSLDEMVKQSRIYVREALNRGNNPIPTCVAARLSATGSAIGGPFGCSHPEHDHTNDLRAVLDRMDVNAVIYIEEIQVLDSDDVTSEVAVLYIEEEGWNWLVEAWQIVSGRDDLIRLDNPRIDERTHERYYPLLPGNGINFPPCPH